MKKRNKWLLVVLAVLVLGLGYGAYTVFMHSGSDYLPVGQFVATVDSYQNRTVNVGGKVAPGSTNWDSSTSTMKFELTDSKVRLPVVYQGFLPDNFKPGADLVVKGKYRDNVLQATSFGRTRSVCNLCH